MKQLTLVFLSLLLGSINVLGQNTPGTVTFTVTTSSNGGKYAPKHVLAIWVKNSAGTFIRTSKLRAQDETKYLYKWKASSNLNTVDAITGATLTSHQTHTVTWNCKDLSNNVVPDGNYQFWVEFTDADSQGPYAQYAFNKTTTAVNTNYPNQSKFSNANITYTPQPIGIEENAKSRKVVVTEHANTVHFNLSGNNGQNNICTVYNLQGQLLYSSSAPVSDGTSLDFIWEAIIPQGIYLYRIVSGKEVYTGKFIHAN